MKPHWLWLLILCLTWTGCSPPPDTAASAPNPKPSPVLTQIPTQAQSSGPPDSIETPAPLTEDTPAIVLEPPVPLATPTYSPPPVKLPLERLSILQPGPGSQVTSPFQVIGRGGPSFNERVELRLLGEDGRSLASSTTYLFAFPGNAGRFAAELSFDISLVAEVVRLEVRTFDRRFGRLDQITSVDLIALSSGRPRIYPALQGPEKLAILSPQEGRVVTGGNLIVEGAGWMDSDVPLTLEVLDSQGQRVGFAQVRIDAPAIGQLGTFRAELAYQVSSRQFGRIAVSEASSSIPGLVHYSSIEVILEP